MPAKKKAKVRKRTVLDKMGRRKGTSDDDTGYLWGKKGKAKAKRANKKFNQKSGYLWKGHTTKKKKTPRKK